MAEIDYTAIRAQVTGTLANLCGHVLTTLRKITTVTANHMPVISAPTDYPVYGVADRIHQIVKPGTLDGQKITTQLLFASADNIPDDEDTTVASQWQYIDAQGKEHSIAAVNPVRPNGSYALVYEVELVR